MNSKHSITAIVACDPNGGIGIDGKLAWNIKDDLLWFKEQTTGHICLASKSLYQRDLKNLKGREWIAISSHPGELAIKEYNYKHYTPKQIAEDLNSDIIIVGGPKVYEWAYDDLTEVIMTGIKQEYKCDAFIDIDKMLKDKHSYASYDKGEYKITLWRKNG